MSQALESVLHDRCVMGYLTILYPMPEAIGVRFRELPRVIDEDTLIADYIESQPHSMR